MPSSFTFYNKFKEHLLNGAINLGSDTVKLALVTSAYIPDPTHDVLADINASPDPEVVAVASPSNGYVAGGNALANPVVTLSDVTTKSKFDADDVVWTALAATFRYGILYVEKSIGSPVVVNPLIGYITFDTAPADISVSGVDFTVQWSPNGIITAI